MSHSLGFFKGSMKTSNNGSKSEEMQREAQNNKEQT